MPKKKKQNNTIWIIKITIAAFIISFIFSFISEITLNNLNIIVGLIALILFILIGVLFDMIGVAVTSADEKPFHSMSAQKVRGANIAVIFKKNAAKVSSFCNDVVGDICGIISGSAGVVISASLSEYLPIDSFYITLTITALVASLTIGGKALGKNIAIKKSNRILFTFSKVISFFYHPKTK